MHTTTIQEGPERRVLLHILFGRVNVLNEFTRVGVLRHSTSATVIGGKIIVFGTILLFEEPEQVVKIVLRITLINTCQA
ncbi:MAG TPA: hypothetical protein VM488_03780 [Pseudobacter sp.]|nr:hypothetical protein [Pseudobacter sp.]